MKVVHVIGFVCRCVETRAQPLISQWTLGINMLLSLIISYLKYLPLIWASTTYLYSALGMSTLRLLHIFLTCWAEMVIQDLFSFK